jgi:hypothetical protein
MKTAGCVLLLAIWGVAHAVTVEESTLSERPHHEKRHQLLRKRHRGQLHSAYAHHKRHRHEATSTSYLAGAMSATGSMFAPLAKIIRDSSPLPLFSELTTDLWCGVGGCKDHERLARLALKLRRDDPQPQHLKLELSDEAKNMKIFCFGWVTFTENDKKLMPYARQLWEACDGHAFFTDVDAPADDSHDVFKVKVSPSKQQRNDGNWLSYKNMIGLAPAWQYMFNEDMLEHYDWAINLELDHFISVPLARWDIATSAETIRKGLQVQDLSSKPVMLNWGNVFVFNKALMGRMKENWQKWAAPITDSSSDIYGCPVMENSYQAEYGQQCPQDIVYPKLFEKMRGEVNQFGPIGCNQEAEAFGQKLPLPCWQGFPFGNEPDDRVNALKEISFMRNIPTLDEAKEHCKRRGGNVEQHCASLYSARMVPVIHNCKQPVVQEAARKFLMP